MLSLRHIVIFLLLLPSVARADFSVDLDSAWYFREHNVAGEWMSATVPGTIHTDLLNDGRIPDPFLADNEMKVQWIDSVTWEYRTTFDCTRAMLREKHVEIQFEGLDTYADVYLNDSLIFTAEDMFLSYTKDVKNLLKKQNTLRVVFHPAAELIEKNRNLSKIKKYPGGDRVFIRKAQYQFGWDWGPRLVTCGIWKPVHLVGWSDFRVDNVQFTCERIENDTAFMVCEYHLVVDKPGKFMYTLSDGDTVYSHESTTEKKGDFGCFFLFQVPHPRLWWCNGLGKQELYHFTFTVSRKKKKVVSSCTTGIRTIELSTNIPGDPDAFYFLVNDVPVFAKGCNWIPSDNFLPRVDQEKISSQLTDMHDLNMNMVRVWGGGIYESDAFYAKCDSLGLMVWQDLPFACAMYPYAELNRNLLLQMEVYDNYYRIHNHPALALICGDNENNEGWFNWEWQKEMKYSAADSSSIYNEYRNFENDIHASMDHSFIASSPMHGWGREKAYREGDVHYWGVWWGMKPFASYETHTGRFVSEFGFQGMPSWHTFNAANSVPTDPWFADSAFMNHQKHPTGYETINQYMARDYGIEPVAFDDYIYLSQVMQRDAMTTAIEAQRRNMPRCMGSLFWQYNDCWPVTSWSVQDYYGRKKLAWYALKPCFDSILVSIQHTSDSVFVWIVNETKRALVGQLDVAWCSFDNKVAFSNETKIGVRPEKSVCAWKGATANFSKSLALDSGYVCAQFHSPRGEKSSASGLLAPADFTSINFFRQSTCVLVRTSDAKFPETNYSLNFLRYIVPGPCTFSIKSNVYLKNVTFTCNDPDAEFSDNGFDMTPGQWKQIEVKTMNSALVEKSIRVRTLNDLVRKQQEKKQED